MWRNIGCLWVLSAVFTCITSGCDDSRKKERSRVVHTVPLLEMTLASMPDTSASRPDTPRADLTRTSGFPDSEKSVVPVESEDKNGRSNESGQKLGNELIDDDQLVGSYSCEFHAKELPLGPFRLNSFGCRVIKDRDEMLKLTSSSGIASLKGTITRLGATGFSITGNYKFPGNRLHFKTHMEKRFSKKMKYEGNGLGIMNEDKTDKKLFSFIMIKEYK